MNTKRFTVVDTRTNSIKTFDSTANTVGELKADLRRQGIDPTGMAIQEGLTKTELGDNDGAYLPHDVPYRGGITNNLVFRLTQKEKRIKSGASRAELYARIKELGIADKIAAKYGKNFTTCRTVDLLEEVEAAEGKCCTPHCDCAATQEALTKLTSILVDDEVITEEEGYEVVDIMGTDLISSDVYSTSEIDEMFSDM